MSAAERFLVTGSMGCIGAWVIRQLVAEGVEVIATDLATDPVRPRLLMDQKALASVDWQPLDVTDTDAVQSLAKSKEINRIVHLAGLQIPFCKANPPGGAAVNVIGTINILEAARHNGVNGLAYASSAAAFGPPDMYKETPIPDSAPLASSNLYGVYKLANEESARVYWQDWQVPSVGLRPYNVYGVGRDQGLTSDIAKSILATAAGQPYNIRYRGDVTLQHAKDVAAIFIACARSGLQGAQVCNLRNDVTTVENFIAALKAVEPAAEVTCSGDVLPFAYDFDDAGLKGLLGEVPHTSMPDAIREDLALYRQLIDANGIDMTQLER